MTLHEDVHSNIISGSNKHSTISLLLFITPYSYRSIINILLASKAVNYISSTNRIIIHSIAAAAKAAVNKTKSILEWFKPVDPEGLNRIRKWKLDQLVHDAFSKKKKRKLKKKNTVQPIRYRQPSLTEYISPLQDLT